jgi:cell division septum initiation protein DivIVA
MALRRRVDAVSEFIPAWVATDLEEENEKLEARIAELEMECSRLQGIEQVAADWMKQAHDAARREADRIRANDGASTRCLFGAVERDESDG